MMGPLLVHLHALCLLLQAAQASGERASENRAEDRGAETRFFQMTIDFWKTGPKKDARPTKTETAFPPSRETIWAEPIRQPDGRYSVYLPPKAVLDFLEDPTPENLKAYLDWKRARAEKLQRAMELLEKYRAEEAALKSKGNPSDDSSDAPTSVGIVGIPSPVPGPSVDSRKVLASVPLPGPKAIQITYFHSKGCPHCTKQDRVLAEWLAEHPDVTVRVLELGESPELWLKHRVRGTPSLLLSDGSNERGVLLEGLSAAARLDQALSSLRRPGQDAPQSPQDPAPSKDVRK